MKRFLVIFQAAHAATESLALAFGLGAVEGSANIRLRHLPGSVPAALEHQGYGRLSSADLAWAEVIGLFLESGEPTGELTGFVEQLRAEQATLTGKWAYVFSSADASASIAFAEQAFHEEGVFLLREKFAGVASEPESMKDVGRRLAGVTEISQLH
ncbi:MAG TPA: hypothetical protein VGC07_01095 [Granulicella sp.]